MRHQKFFVLALIALTFCGCLVPGAPYNFYFKQHVGLTSSNLKVTSHQFSGDFFYTPAKPVDSVYVLDTMKGSYQRMKFDPTDNTYQYHRREHFFNANLRRWRKTSTTVFRSYLNGKLTMDTLVAVREMDK